MRLGFRKADIMAERLSVDEMASVCVAAQPGSAVFHAVNEGWTITDHLLATMSEQQAGLVTLPYRHVRPGVTDIDTRQRPPTRFDDRNNSMIMLDVMPLHELMERLGG